MSKYTNLLNEQMKESLESYIIEHALAPGDALPSERELAENLGGEPADHTSCVKTSPQ